MKAKYEFTISGFIISLLIISMVTVGMAMFLTELQTDYAIPGNSSLSAYDFQNDVSNITQDVRNQIDSNNTNNNLLDLVGAFFGQGLAAVKVTFKSFGLFSSITNQASQDLPILSYFTNQLSLIVLIAIVLGVVVAALVKWRI